MATVNLGRIKSVWRGTWATGTAYSRDDVVQEGVNSYICTQAHTAGATFAGDSANWDLMAQGADIPSQSGQSGKILKTDGSALSWAEDTGGTVVQAHTSIYTGADQTSSTMGGQLSVTFAPQYADSRFLFMCVANFGQSNHDCSAGIKFDISGAAPGGTVSPAGSGGQGNRTFALGGVGSSAALGTSFADWAIQQNTSHFLYEPSTNMGTASRTFQVLVSRIGNAGSVIFNRTWNSGTDARRITTTSVLTVMELRA